jgi:hypothetical protein
MASDSGGFGTNGDSVSKLTSNPVKSAIRSATSLRGHRSVITLGFNTDAERLPSKQLLTAKIEVGIVCRETVHEMGSVGSDALEVVDRRLKQR